MIDKKCPFGGSYSCEHNKEEFSTIPITIPINYCEIAVGDCIGKCPENLLEYNYKNFNLKLIDEHLKQIKNNVFDGLPEYKLHGLLNSTDEHLIIRNSLISMIDEIMDLINELDLILSYDPLGKLKQIEVI